MPSILNRIIPIPYKLVRNILYFIFRVIPLLRIYHIRKFKNILFLHRAAPYIYHIKLLNSLNIYESNKKNTLFVDLNDIKFEIQTTEEWFILEEIFFKGEYNFLVPFEYVLIDIGMNVGLSSLFFAAKKEVKKIYSFEPVKPTFTWGLNNFILNPHLYAKIESFNVGISRHSREEWFYYKKEESGNSRKIEINYTPHIMELIQVELKAVKEVLTPIVAQHQNDPIICKIDCEGAEYEIIDSLVEEKLIRNIYAFVMEWHKPGNENLLAEKMRNHGFIVVLKHEYDHMGLIYAINTKFQ